MENNQNELTEEQEAFKAEQEAFKAEQEAFKLQREQYEEEQKQIKEQKELEKREKIDFEETLNIINNNGIKIANKNHFKKMFNEEIKNLKPQEKIKKINEISQKEENKYFFNGDFKTIFTKTINPSKPTNNFIEGTTIKKTQGKR